MDIVGIDEVCCVLGVVGIWYYGDFVFVFMGKDCWWWFYFFDGLEGFLYLMKFGEGFVFVFD